MKQVEYGHKSLLNGSMTIGKLKRANLSEDGKLSDVCYRDLLPLPRQVCKPSSSSEGQESIDYLQAVNYQIQKAVNCCRPSSQGLEVQCSL